MVRLFIDDGIDTNSLATRTPGYIAMNGVQS